MVTRTDETRQLPGTEKAAVAAAAFPPPPISLPPTARRAREGWNWRYWTFRAGLALAARTPRFLGYRLAALGGEFYFWLNPRHSGKAVANYAILLADHPRAPRVRATARRSFRNYGKYLFDFFRLPALDPDRLEAGVVSEGWEYLDAALAEGQGAIIVTPHFGNWDFAGTLMAIRGYPISAVADTFSPPAVDRLVRRTRECMGLGVIPLSGSGSLRQIQRALRRNQVVALVCDRPQRDGAVEVAFFGSRAWLPTGPARMALRSGAPILLGYVLRRPGDHSYYGGIEPAIPFTPTGNVQADVQALTQAIATRLEGLLRRHPDQWYMFRQMWPDVNAERGTRNAEDLADNRG